MAALIAVYHGTSVYPTLTRIRFGGGYMAVHAVYSPSRLLKSAHSKKQTSSAPAAAAPCSGGDAHVHLSSVKIAWH